MQQKNLHFYKQTTLMELLIEITDGCNNQSRSLNDTVTLNSAVGYLCRLYENDYLNLTYILWVNEKIYLTLEHL